MAARQSITNLGASKRGFAAASKDDQAGPVRAPGAAADGAAATVTAARDTAGAAGEHPERQPFKPALQDR